MHRFVLCLVISTIAVAAPAWTLAGDREIAQKIADSIRQSGSLTDYSIGVKYKDGTAWLRGRVQNRQQVARALEIAQSDPEVLTVVNELKAPTQAELAWSPELGQKRSSGSSSFVSKISGLFTGKKPTQSWASSAKKNIGRSSAESSRRRTSQSTAISRSAQSMPRPSQFAGRQVANNEILRPPSVTIGQAIKRATGRAKPAPETFAPVSARMLAAGTDSGAYYPAAQRGMGAPIPTYVPGTSMGVAPVAYDHPHMPNYAWPSYAAHPNYAGLTYPKQYSATAWPYIGPFYPYPQVPLGWRKVTLEWDDGWWFLDFDDKNQQHDSCWWW